MTALGRRLRAAALAALFIVPLTPAQMAAAEPTVTTEDGPILALDSVTPAVLTPSTTLVVGATVTGGAEAAADVQVRVRIDGNRLRTTDALGRWLERTENQAAGQVIATQTVDGGLGSHQSTQISLSIDPATLGLPTSGNAGPRGLAIELRVDGQRVSLLRTVISWAPVESERSLGLSVLVPLAAPTADPATGLVTAGDLGPYTTKGGALAALTDHLTDPYYTWALDPALADSAASDGPTTQEWLDQLTRSARADDMLLLPYGDTDLAAVAHAGKQDVLRSALDRQRTASLADLGLTTTDSVAWPVDGVVDASTVQTIAAAGLTSIVVAEDSIGDREDSGSARTTLTSPAGDLSAVVADGELSGLLSSTTADNAAAAILEFVARLQLRAGSTSDGQSILVTLPRTWAPGDDMVKAFAAAVRSMPWTSPRSLTELLAEPAADTAAPPVTATATNEMPASEFADVAASQQELSVLASALADPAAEVDPLTLGGLTLASAAWRDRPEGRAEAIVAYGRQVTDRLGQVSIDPGSSLTMVSETPKIPVMVRNDLDQAITVAVRISSWPARLAPTTSEAVTIEPRSVKQVHVPVEVLANGDVTVKAELLTREGLALGATRTFEGQAHADWENIGTAIIAGALVILVVIGIVRVIRRGRLRDGTILPRVARMTRKTRSGGTQR